MGFFAIHYFKERQLKIYESSLKSMKKEIDIMHIDFESKQNEVNEKEIALLKKELQLREKERDLKFEETQKQIHQANRMIPRKLREMLGGKIIHPQTDLIKQKATLLTFYITPGMVNLLYLLFLIISKFGVRFK